jgi:hypothetical protein
MEFQFGNLSVKQSRGNPCKMSVYLRHASDEKEYLMFIYDTCTGHFKPMYWISFGGHPFFDVNMKLLGFKLGNTSLYSGRQRFCREIWKRITHRIDGCCKQKEKDTDITEDQSDSSYLPWKTIVCNRMESSCPFSMAL